MAPNRGRTSVVLLCLLAVALVGVQFPVAGLGSAPDAGGPLGTPAGVAGAPDGSDDGDATTLDPGVTTDLDRQPATTTRSDETATDGNDETATPTATPTERPTTVAAGGESESGGGGLLETLATGVAVVVAIVVGGYATVMRTRRGHRLFRGTVRAAEGLPVVGTAVSAVVGGAGRGLSTLPRRTMRFAVGASASAPRLLDAIGGAVGEVTGGLRVAVGSVGGGVGRALLRAPAGLAAGLAGMGRAFGGGLLSLPGGVTSMFDGLRSGGTELREDRPAADARSASDVDPEEPADPDPPGSVAEAWRRMVEAARVRRHETKTPVEVARAAVRRGLPAEPVGRLTNLFRRVRYGGEGGPDVLSTAREALDDVEDADGGEGS